MKHHWLVYEYLSQNSTPGEEQSEWQSYFLSEDGQRVVAPYYELGNQPKSHSNFQLDFKHTECNLWNNYYWNETLIKNFLVSLN